MEEIRPVYGELACPIKLESPDVMENDITKYRILVDIGLGRKKVFIAHSGSSLLHQFHQYINSEPAFSDLLSHSFPVLQEFNTQFETWVDLDTKENLKDGAVFKAVFFPNKVEADETKPGAIKRKRDDSDSDIAPKQKLQCIRPEYDEQSSVSLNISSQCDETKLSKNILSSGKSKVLSKRKETINIEEKELMCENYPVKETPHKKNNTTTKTKCCICKNHIKQKTPLNKNNSSKNTPITENNATEKSLQEKTAATKISPRINISTTSKTPQIKNNATLTTLPNTPAEPSEKQPQNVKSCSNLESSNSNVSVTNINIDQSLCTVLDEDLRNVADTNKDDVEITYCNFSNTPVPSVSEVSSADMNKSQSECIQPNVVEQTCNNSSVVQLASQVSSADDQCTLKEQSSLKWITWTSQFFSVPQRTERLNWGRKVKHMKWRNTIFADVLEFSLHGNQIKSSCKGDKSTGFWICLTPSGPETIVPIFSSVNSSVLLHLLQDLITSFASNGKKIHGISLQTMKRELTLFKSRNVKNFLIENKMCVRFWPSSARNISPIYHACKLVEEKVKNVHCSTKEDMISVISQIWESDLDLKSMCKKYVSSLPKIIKSMIELQGNDPDIEIVWE